MAAAGRGSRRTPEVTDYTVRQANEDDLGRLVAMRLALQAHLERRVPSLWRLSEQGKAQAREKLTPLLQDADTLVLVAVAACGEAIGVAVGHVHQQPELVPAMVGLIDTLFVEEAWRRRGVGHALVAKLVEFLAAKGAAEITLRYVVGNEEGERFWGSLGFQPRIITANASPQALEARLR